MSKRTFKRKFAEYMRRTALNKLWAIMLTGLGFIPVLVDGNATALVILLPLAIAIFFAKDNWIG